MAFSPRSIRRNILKIEETQSGNIKIFKEILPPIVAKMTWGPNEVILDHGYNSGRKAFEILGPIAEKTGATIYVLDNCPHTFEHAETNYPHAKIKNLLGDLNLPPGTLGDLRFTKIFSLYGMHFTQDYKSALKSMYEHLLPGGEAFFLIPTKSSILDTDKLLLEHPEWTVHAEDHFTVDDFVYDGKDNSGKLKDAFTEIGFEIIKFDLLDVKSLTFKNVKEVADFSAALNPFLLLLPKKAHAELEEFYYNYFLETKTEFYTPGVDSPDKPYILPYTCVHVLAKKPE